VPTAPSAPPSLRRTLAIGALLALAYAATGRAGLELASYQANATLIWPPTGLALAALTLVGRRLWPAVLIGAFVVNASVGTPLTTALLIALGNTLEAVVGSALLTSVGKLDARFARLRDVLVLVSLGAVSCTVSATVGVAALGLGELLAGRDPALVWVIWWLGDAGGVLTVAPLVLVGVRGGPPWRELARRAEAWLVLALLALTAGLAFGGAIPAGWQAELFAFAPFPFCVWAGIRLGPRGAVTASVLVGLIAALGTTAGLGSFAEGDAQQRAFLLFAYVTTLGTTAMILAAAIAEREAVERERRALESRVERAQRLESLALLAGGVAHDFNNLLTVMRSHADLIRQHVEPDAPVAARVDAIETAVERASELCRQLLTYAGRGSAERAAVDLRKLTEEIARLLEAALPKTVALTLELDAEPTVVLGDTTQLRQLVMNLVVNAGEAIGAERRGRVIVRTRQEAAPTGDDGREELSWSHPEAGPGPFVVVDVEDDGPGMDHATLERIFEPFYSTKAMGRGLGMATVLGVVSAHRGSITVRTAPGRGARFVVRLPASRELTIEAPVRVKSNARTGTVLLADDEPLVRGILGELLTRAGWTVDQVEDGDEAVARFEEAPTRYDAVLLDVGMPGMQGPEALARIRALRGDVHAVLMSGHDPGAIEGIPDVVYLRKPFDVTSLREALEPHA
jgi:signal transduction histidine kinase